MTDLVLPAELPPVVSRPRLSEVLPVEGRTPAEKALELGRVQQVKARLAAYEVDLIAGLATDRPAAQDRRPDPPGAAAPPPRRPGRVRRWG